MKIQRIEGRTDPATVTVAAYRCLTPSKPTWSLQATEGVDKGKVIGYADDLVLTNCSFVVRRQTWRTIVDGLSKRGRKRNVVAWVTGKLADAEQYMPEATRVDFVFYPEHAPAGVTAGEFYRTDTGEIVHSADAVRFSTVTDAAGKSHGVAFI